MTSPRDRTHSLLAVREFLLALRAGEMTMEDARQEAHQILQHYPNAAEIDHLAAVEAIRLENQMLPMTLLTRVLRGKAQRL